MKWCSASESELGFAINLCETSMATTIKKIKISINYAKKRWHHIRCSTETTKGKKRVKDKNRNKEQETVTNVVDLVQLYY